MMFDFFKKKPTEYGDSSADKDTPSSWFSRLKQGLGKTRDQLNKQIVALWSGGQIDEALYEALEAALLSADVGLSATQALLERVRQQLTLRQLSDPTALREELQRAFRKLLEPLEKPLDLKQNQPFVVLVAGVNGAGKTTSLGKLAQAFRSQGKSVLLAAGDTFRAAAKEQLVEWGSRAGVGVISQQGGDPAAVAFDAVRAAIARKIDVVLIDSAGRLPTQPHLLEELRKVKRAIAKAEPSAPHGVWLVIDANTGQNALQQVLAFDQALQLTGLILTKLDGTARGGVVAAIAQTRPIPLQFIGVGEGIDDLKPFIVEDFVRALFDD